MYNDFFVVAVIVFDSIVVVGIMYSVVVELLLHTVSDGIDTGTLPWNGIITII